jgi:hypothetical protein
MYNLDPYYFKLKAICEEEGISLKRNMSVSNGSDEYFSASFADYKHQDGKLSAIFLTYYEAGFEVLGEIKIDLDYKKITIEFPSWQVFVKNNF